MRVQRVLFAVLPLAVCVAGASFAPRAAAQNASNIQGPVRLTLDQAIQLALQHNHALLAARTTIQQSKAEEITANLRPNPVLLGDALFVPFFQPSDMNSDFLNTSSEFDLGVSYLFERGKKRQHRLRAAQDQTAVTEAQVADNERTVTFQVASQFIAVQLAESALNLAEQDLKDFQNTVNISQERYRAGDISEDDLLKMKLQLLQFQTDASQAQLAKVQARNDLRELLGYDSVPADYDVAGALEYQPIKGNLEDFQAKALATRPDLRAAQRSVTAAQSQYELAKAQGKKDVTAQMNYTHVSAANTASIFGQIQIPIFDRNQGEIARANYAIAQAQQQKQATSNQVLTDVRDAYESVQSNNQVIQLYQSGYLDESKQDLDISEYAYRRGAASLLDFLDAERSYRTTELGYRQALASYLTAVEQLREAVGSRSLP